MDNYIRITIPFSQKSLADILVAQLSEIGYEGFEEKTGSIDAFILEPNFDNKELEALLTIHSLAYSKTSVAPENWNKEWEKNFEPVTVDDFCAIRASFHSPIKEVDHEIVITPKMSFGTGHHATTWQMVKAMSKIDFPQAHVLDFGTGTGILAILAEKLGAKVIVAIDNDDWSIENAIENIQQNHCTKIQVRKRDSITELGEFDIILANINKMVILGSLKEIKQHLKPQGVLIISGFLSSDFLDIENESIRNGFQFLSKNEKDSWLCLSLNLVQNP